MRFYHYRNVYNFLPIAAKVFEINSSVVYGSQMIFSAKLDSKDVLYRSRRPYVTFTFVDGFIGLVPAPIAV